MDNKSQQVRKQALEAFIDCRYEDKYPETYTVLTDHFILKADAVRILDEAGVGNKYFHVGNTLAAFPADCEMKIAREYSPCLYVKQGTSPLPSKAQVDADELERKGDTWRYWWD